MSYDHLRWLAQAATPGLQPADFRKLRYAAECATQGTWRNGTDPCHFDAPEVTDDKSFAYYVPDAKNAAFIAAASPSVVLSLLDALDAARAEVERLRRERDSYANSGFESQISALESQLVTLTDIAVEACDIAERCCHKVLHAEDRARAQELRRQVGREGE